MTQENNKPAVWSCNEWDPLEEVIVGSVEGATVPEYDDVALQSIMPDHAANFFKEHGGKPFPSEMIDSASAELNILADTLKSLGVKVRRPDKMDFSKEYVTPWWKSKGLYAAMPRDVMMVIGDTIVEAPMAWRSRYFEIYAFRNLIQEYFKGGAKWLSAPKPSMNDAFYNDTYNSDEPYKDGVKQFVISENEVAFDAADFFRCGKDIFVQKSNVTNQMGIDWVARQIGTDYKIHEVEFGDPHPMHIETTVLPLAPGKLLINPTWVKKIPEIFKDWEILVAPEPTKLGDSGMYFSSDWLTMNMLSVNEKQVILDEQETPLIEALKSWGFEPITIPFRNFYAFGGSVHCATADIRRRGELKSYF